jgi:hypothetical protein
MFGKKSKMSTNDRAVMAMGRANGNLKGASAFGTSSKGESRGTKGGARGKDSPDPFKPRTLKVGKNSGFTD